MFLTSFNPSNREKETYQYSSNQDSPDSISRGPAEACHRLRNLDSGNRQTEKNKIKRTDANKLLWSREAHVGLDGFVSLAAAEVCRRTPNWERIYWHPNLDAAESRQTVTHSCRLLAAPTQPYSRSELACCSRCARPARTRE